MKGILRIQLYNLHGLIAIKHNAIIAKINYCLLLDKSGVLSWVKGVSKIAI